MTAYLSHPTSADTQIVPIAVVLENRVGLTLWAEPACDPIDGRTRQGLLGVGDTIMLFPTAVAVRTFIDAGTPNDLDDHPGWPALAARGADQLRAAPEDTFNLDSMFDLVASDPTPEAVAEANMLLYLVSSLADWCGDDTTYELLTTDPGFAPFANDVIRIELGALEPAWDQLRDSTVRQWTDIRTKLHDWFEFTDDFKNIDRDELRAPGPFRPPWQPAHRGNVNTDQPAPNIGLRSVQWHNEGHSGLLARYNARYNARRDARLDAEEARVAAFHAKVNHGMREITCPHCHKKGQVSGHAVTLKRGISGGKATAAVLTGGASLLATGLSRKQRGTALTCGNCKMRWTV